MLTRSQILVRGIVQGVGFRPFIYSLANSRALRGCVLNNAAGVVIDVEGSPLAIEQFILEIKSNPPPLSIVDSIECNSNLTPANYREFRIVESDENGHKSVPISADIATCQDCLRELFDPQDRRYRYPFINCTNCGPRFTIVEDVPYDRAKTTMRDFAMCARCKAEYEDPLDRRFHAEPTACPLCGPQLFLLEPLAEQSGAVFAGRYPSGPSQLSRSAMRSSEAEADADAVAMSRTLLLAGNILAIKGIGGFHLVCDALNAGAVERLRQRKYREDKPFAMMAESLAVIENYCRLSVAEKKLLLSEQRPIVLLESKTAAVVPPSVAPGVKSLGFMLPYAPLHHLLLEGIDRPLVFTSGNVSDEPICYENEDAVKRLRHIAEYFLLHDRRIRVRSDDSVARLHGGNEVVLRRSRGYAPSPIKTGVTFGREILACGAELKNTFCLTRDRYAFMSHHIGDLENLETFRSFTDGIAYFKRLFHLEPQVVAYDLHPEYLSTKYALALDDGLTKVGVQHHHAHIASCLADNNSESEVIGVAMDGLGFGTDGRMWGGEFFIADFREAERVAHLDYVPMPGGAKAIREPWRMAAMYLQNALGDDFLDLDLPFTLALDRRCYKTIRRMAVTGTNSPETSSMGRLFDAVSSLIGLRNFVNYEGQAAIELEAIAAKGLSRGYKFGFSEDGSVISAAPVVRRVVEDLLEKVSPEEVSAKFHLGVAELIGSITRRIRDERRLNQVALSGGVFQNSFLLGKTCQILKADGFEVFTHRRVPPNDGGISLGQAVIANAQLTAGRF